MALINIRTVDDLKKVLHKQRLITRQAKDELLAVANDQMLQDPMGQVVEDAAKIEGFMNAEQQLLEKYAKYPTLTEWNAQPTVMTNLTKWGATFGVTVIVGELVLEQVRSVLGATNPLQSVLRPMYLLLLAELNKPKHQYLVEPLEKSLKFEIQAPNGKTLTPEERAAYIRRMVTVMVDAFLRASLAYGLVQVPENQKGFAITPLGQRVYLHLKDAQVYIDILADAHKRFQDELPNLKMI